MIKRQFAPAGGASFTPVMPVGHNVAPQTKVDFTNILNGASAFMQKKMKSAFEQGEIDQMAGAYEQGKYWYLGDAYKNGAQYAIAQNDIAQAQVDITRILNEGLAKGQDSTETMRKVQQRTASIMSMVDDFSERFPEAANMLKQQVKQLHYGSMSEYAKGEYATFMRNMQTGDQLAMHNTVNDLFSRLPLQDNGYAVSYDPKQIIGGIEDQWRTLVANAQRRGSKNPQAEASSYLMNALNARLVGAQMDDPQAVAMVNAMRGLSEQMLQRGMIGLDDYNTAVNNNLARINEARKYIAGQIQLIAAKPTGTPEEADKVNSMLKALRTSGVDGGAIASLYSTYQTSLNQLNSAKAVQANLVDPNPANFSKYKKFTQDKFGNDKLAYSYAMANMVQTNGSFQAAVEAGSAFSDVVNAALSDISQMGLKVDPQQFGVMISQLIPSASTNPILAEQIRKKLDPDMLDFLSANASSIVQEITAGTFNQATLQDRFQKFKTNKGNFQPERDAITDFAGLRIGDMQITPWGLNANLQDTAANLIANSANTISANLARFGVGYTSPSDSMKRLQQYGFVSRTKGDYFIIGSTDVSSFLGHWGDVPTVNQALQNLMKHAFTANGSRYQTDNDQVFAWLDSKNGRIVLYRDDKYGANSTILSYSDLMSQIGKVKSQKDAIKEHKNIGVLATSEFGKIPQVDQKQWKTELNEQLNPRQATVVNAIKQGASVVANKWTEGMSPALDLAKAELQDIAKIFDSPYSDYNSFVWNQNVRRNMQADKKLQQIDEQKRRRHDNLRRKVIYEATFGSGTEPTQSTVPVELQMFNKKIITSAQQLKDFSSYMVRRMNGTLNSGASAYKAILDNAERTQIKKFQNTDMFALFPNSDQFRDVFLKYFGEYRVQKLKAVKQELQSKINNSQPEPNKVKENTMKVLQKIRASNGRKGINTYYITDTTMQGALGPSLGPKVMKHLASVQGFILEPRITNPKASTKAVVGLGYDYGYPRFNRMFTEAQGDAQKLSEATNKFALWMFDQIPNDFEKTTGLSFLECRDDSRLQPLFIGATDFAWHSGKGNKSYWKAIAMVKNGDLQGAMKALKSTQAYRESQLMRKGAYTNGLAAYNEYLKSR